MYGPAHPAAASSGMNASHSALNSPRMFSFVAARAPSGILSIVPMARSAAGMSAAVGTTSCSSPMASASGGDSSAPSCNVKSPLVQGLAPYITSQLRRVQGGGGSGVQVHYEHGGQGESLVPPLYIRGSVSLSLGAL